MTEWSGHGNNTADTGLAGAAMKNQEKVGIRANEQPGSGSQAVVCWTSVVR